ncbi:MAG: response regulator [Bacteroidales bacterium]|nr:response regulator [Bacteroidales bacterium]
MNKQRLTLLLLAVLCSIAPVRAQRFCPIGVQDGISDGFVRGIVCDRDGYVWFATQNGLDRYDGYNFRRYSLSGLGESADVFISVAVDGGGHIWANASGGDAYLYDPDTDCLSKDIFPVLEDAGIHTGEILSISVDEEDNLWVETPDTLFIRYFAKDVLAAIHLPGRIESIATTCGTSFATLDDGEIWSLFPEYGRVEPDIEGGHFRIRGDMSGRLWIFGESAGFLDTGTNTWTFLKPGTIPDGDIVKCMTESDNGIWIGTDRNGIVVLNDRMERVRTIESDKTKEFTLPSNHINCIYQKNGIIWIGTGQKGAAYTIVNDLDIRRIRSTVSEDIGTIAEDASGKLYIGYDGKGLMYLDEGGFRPVPLEGYGSVMSSYLDDNGTLYFGTFGDGAFIWDGRKAEPVGSTPEIRRATQYSRYFTKDAAGRLWIATYNRGLVRLDRDGSMRNYTTDNSELESSSISSMAGPAGDGTIYISNRHRLYSISPATLELTAIESGLRQITHLFIDGRDILWVGTTDGLYYLDRQGTPVLISIEDGLTDNHIQGICEDHYGNLWVTADEGFSCVFITEDPSSGSILVHCYPYFEEDGTGKGHFSRNAIFCSSSGDILMGNDGDIVVARPKPYAPKHYDAGITVTGVSISSEPLLPSGYRDAEIIRMKHHDNLSIEVSTLDFHNRRAVFEYRFEGEEEWNTLASNVLFLRSINPGQHVIEIRPVNAGNNGSAARIRIHVSPPFYRSLPAYCFYSLLLAAAILLLVKKLRERKLRRTEKEQRHMEEAKMQFFTNISHDLRTPLSMIITPLEHMMHSGDGQAFEKEMEQIDRNAKALLDEIDLILDFKQVSGGTPSFKPAFGDIARFTEETCRTYPGIVRMDDAELKTDTGTAPVMTCFDRDKYRRILHNLLSNAFKYGRKDGSKTVVSVTVREEDGQAVIRVADNGPGISEKSKSRIFERFYREGGKDVPGSGIGLNIVQEYVRLHGGTVSISDNRPSGCIFTVSLPIRNEGLEQTAEVQAFAGIPSSGREHILVVEDNPDFRAFVTDSLSSSYDITEATNGQEALELVRNGDFNLILSDVVMPEMDGRELCRSIRADIRIAGTPVILMTAVHGKEAELENLKAGADDTLEKPFDIETLRLRIGNILKRNGSKAADRHGTAWRGSKEDRELLERIRKEVEEHMQENDYNVEELSSTLNISRSVLYKRLITLTGESPIEFIRSIRLGKGKEMIENGETSVSQIAWSVGYTPKQFSRNFKAEYGCLPSEYLRHLKE